MTMNPRDTNIQGKTQDLQADSCNDFIAFSSLAKIRVE